MRRVLVIVFALLSACASFRDPQPAEPVKPQFHFHWRPASPSAVCLDPPLEWPIGVPFGYSPCTLIAD